MRLSYKFDKKTKTETVETDEKFDQFIEKLAGKTSIPELIKGVREVVKDLKSLVSSTNNHK